MAMLDEQALPVIDVPRNLRAYLSRWALEPARPTWDPYDLWGLSPGVWIRRGYYRGRAAYRLAAAAYQLLDLVLGTPLRTLFCRRHLYPSSLAQRATAALLLYDDTGDRRFLEAARRHWSTLADLALQPRPGMLAWGLPFDWESKRGYYPAGTPFITQTAYALEAALGLWKNTRDETYREAAFAIFRFIRDGVVVEQDPGGGVRSSYSPIDRAFIHNSIAYRAYSLALASRWDLQPCMDESDEAWRYVLHYQHSDGSWTYGEEAGDRYVDNYHTTFILKNLLKSLLLGGTSLDLASAFHRGLRYYVDHLFHPETRLPRPYARAPRFNPFSLDGYDLAEAIALAGLLRFCPPDLKQRLQPEVDRFLQDLPLLLSFPALHGARYLWRRYVFPFYRDYERWARAPYLLGIALLATSSVPFFLRPESSVSGPTGVSAP